GGGPSLIGLKEDDRIKILQKIQKGAGLMPAYWEVLSPKEMEQLVDWLLFGLNRNPSRGG
ncbi:MAG: cytochrome c, partial [Candidatus Tectomicrobia bacterium]|nr:cytochrome c [Candidatus Tectomicrobia bacterium]